ncbi:MULTISPECIES: hypothetical protein [Cyanophyceae]|jgi:hypothetical protein|uniref:Uncharacterized protein n=1 Tax=Aphanothece cf. minutissima CCALA 015 TaxID=2107695 RepID=A0ABX5F5S9_9CHRO|nr:MULTISPECIES: hypothetical protein [Cyanophyceae]MCP9797956.1 hypothetical protein [Cyanobium sp. Lug-B]MCP9933312.1 hypothetical protein [Cyanobium sp. Candia 9D4]PSB36713.1 hypothetical protein C7B81_12305 [Aphanothece cf. minutissima CCALA 015]
MAADPLDSLRLALMQDVLPVGLAVVERVRKGGPAEVLAAFDGTSADPLGQLRQEGEPAASQVRENLDRFQPGLGNPVMKVEVRDVGPEEGSAGPFPGAAPAAWDAPPPPNPADPAELLAALERIETRLALLQSRLG